MPSNHVYTLQEVIEKTSEVIRLFYSRHIDPIAAMLDDNFVWIGAYEFQYLRGKKEFLLSIESESNETPVHVSQEEFKLLAHDHNLWTVYGRFTATAMQEDNTLLLAKIRNTFVWKQVNNDLILMHIHGSHARDVPMEFDGKLPPSVADAVAWFEYIKGVDRTVGPPKKLIFREQDGIYHFVLPSEIIYIKAEEKRCIIFTGNDSFTSRITLKELVNQSPLFLQSHRSYLVNLHSVKSICRYRMKLVNGEILPIGKERYMDVKERLQNHGIERVL